MRNKIFSLFLIIILMIGLFIIIKPHNDISDVERRYLSTKDNLKDSHIFDLSFQNKFEDMIKDQFIFRNESIKAYYNTKKLLYSPVLSGLIKMEDDAFYLPEYDAYLLDIPYADDGKIKSVADRAYNINLLHEKFKDLKVYVYHPTRLEETDLLEAYGANSYGNEYRNIFLEQLSGDIRYSELKLNSIEEYLKYYYKGDFHWTIDGAYQGYVDIISMINQDFDIGNPKEILERIDYTQDFYGNLSSNVGQTTKPEHLSDIKLKDIGEFTFKINDELAQYPIKDFNNKTYEKSMGYSDYDVYYGNYEFKKEFDFNDDSKPNLLVINDSFMVPNNLWIASHFNKSLFIDLRSSNKPKDFVIDDLIEEYDIDTVLVSMVYPNLYFNGYFYIPYR